MDSWLHKLFMPIELKMPFDFDGNAADVERFYKIKGGSPLPGCLGAQSHFSQVLCLASQASPASS